MAALFQIADTLQVTAGGSLRGLQDTKMPMLIMVASYWIIGLGSACVAPFVLDLEQQNRTVEIEVELDELWISEVASRPIISPTTGLVVVAMSCWLNPLPINLKASLDRKEDYMLQGSTPSRSKMNHTVPLPKLPSKSVSLSSTRKGRKIKFFLTMKSDPSFAKS